MEKEEIDSAIMHGQQTAFLIGMISGEIAHLLYRMKAYDLSQEAIYRELSTIHNDFMRKISEVFYERHL